MKNMFLKTLATIIILYFLEAVLLCKTYDNIIFEPYFYKDSLSVEEISNGTKANLVSKLNYGFDFLWRQNWGKRYKSSGKSYFSTNIFFNLERHSYKTLETRNFDKNNFSKYSYGIGFTYFLTSTMYINIAATYGDQEYFRSVSTNNVTFDIARAYIGSYTFAWDFLQDYPANMGLDFTYKSIFSQLDNDFHKDSYAYSIGSSIFFSYSDYIMKFIYEKTYKDTDLFKQIYTRLLFKVGVKWDI